MSKLHEAADAIERQLKAMEAWKTAADALRHLGNLEQAEREANDRVNAIQRRANEAAQALRVAQEAASAQEQANAEALQRTHDEAAAIVGKADAYAAESKAQAERQADEILRAAQTASSETRAAAGAALAAVEATRDALKTECGSITARRDAAAAELAQVEGRLKAAREAVKAALA